MTIPKKINQIKDELAKNHRYRVAVYDPETFQEFVSRSFSNKKSRDKWVTKTLDYLKGGIVLYYTLGEHIPSINDYNGRIREASPELFFIIDD